MIFQHLHSFPTLTSKCPKGRFVALRLIYHNDPSMPKQPRHRPQHVAGGAKLFFLCVFCFFALLLLHVCPHYTQGHTERLQCKKINFTKTITSSPMGNDAHLRAIIQSEKKNGNINFSDA